MDTLEAISAANESALKVVTAIQDQILDASKELAPALQGALTPPAVPSWWSVPEPKQARSVLAEAFEFQSRLLEADKSFALSLLDVWVPKPASSTKAK